MRVILYSSTNSDHLNMDVLALRELRGYDAITYFEMGRPDYRNQGMTQSPLGMAHWLAVEMIDGATIVVHADTDPAAAMELDHVAGFLGAPLCRLGDLPTYAPTDQESIDAFRAEYTGRPRKAAPRASVAHTEPKKDVPLTSFTNPVLEIDDDGHVMERPMTLREWWSGLRKRWHHWESRFNARYGRVLKNPVSRELAGGQPPPRPYRLDTSPPIITH